MVYQIHSAKGPQAADKAKAKARLTETTNGPSFAAVLTAAEQAASAETPAPAGYSGGGLAAAYLPLEQETVPADTRSQTAQLLKSLREMANAALGGTGQVNSAQLQALAHAAGTDAASLTSAQTQVVNEARTRAAVEAAKIQK